MIFSFFVVLPQGPLHTGVPKQRGYEAIAGEDDEQEAGGRDQRELDGLLSNPARNVHSIQNKDSLNGFRANLTRASGLFFP
jgi:battenin